MRYEYLKGRIVVNTFCYPNGNLYLWGKDYIVGKSGEETLVFDLGCFSIAFVLKKGN